MSENKRLVELTEAELQFLVSLLKDEISCAQNQIYYNKERCTSFYDLCDPDENGWYAYFMQLNEHKDRLKLWKTLNKKLSWIQTKLKRAR